MKLDARMAAWLLPLLLSACAHNTNVSQNQLLAPRIDDTPPPPLNLPSPVVIDIPKTGKPVVVVQEQPPKQPPKHKRPALKTPGTSPANGSGGTGTQVAENAAQPAPPSEVTAGGNFTTPPESSNSKKQAEDSIAEIEKGLSGIAHKLSDTEEKTSLQIKEYLKEARTALSSGDVEAANNLTKKARALLGELSP